MTIEYREIIKPRIYDINYGGHLGHVELVTLLHEVRAQFLKKHNLSEISINDHALLMKELNLSYLNQAFWDNELHIDMKIKKEGAKIIFEYIVNNLTLKNKTATGEARMVLVDKNSQKPVKPEYFFEKITHGNRSSRN